MARYVVKLTVFLSTSISARFILRTWVWSGPLWTGVGKRCGNPFGCPFSKEHWWTAMYHRVSGQRLATEGLSLEWTSMTFQVAWWQINGTHVSFTSDHVKTGPLHIFSSAYCFLEIHQGPLPPEGACELQLQFRATESCWGIEVGSHRKWRRYLVVSWQVL